jgi:hypothetical protein
MGEPHTWFQVFCSSTGLTYNFPGYICG